MKQKEVNQCALEQHELRRVITHILMHCVPLFIYTNIKGKETVMYVSD